MISQCLADESMTEQQRISQALFLLFGAGMPNDIKIALEGLKWFLNCGQEISEEASKSSEISFDFDIDHFRILSAFKQRYGVDLKTASLHWFEFIAMFGDLGECGLTSLMEYRTKDLSNMKGKEKQMWAKLKNRYSLKKKISSGIADEELKQLAKKLNQKE